MPTDKEYWAVVGEAKAESRATWGKQRHAAIQKKKRRKLRKKGIPWQRMDMPPNMSYARYINSRWWRALRKKRLALDKHRCCYCGGRAWQCHHEKYPSDYRLDCLDNIRSACGACHIARHPDKVAQ